MGSRSSTEAKPETVKEAAQKHDGVLETSANILVHVVEDIIEGTASVVEKGVEMVLDAGKDITTAGVDATLTATAIGLDTTADVIEDVKDVTVETVQKATANHCVYVRIGYTTKGDEQTVHVVAFSVLIPVMMTSLETIVVNKREEAEFARFVSDNKNRRISHIKYVLFRADICTESPFRNEPELVERIYDDVFEHLGGGLVDIECCDTRLYLLNFGPLTTIACANVPVRLSEWGIEPKYVIERRTPSDVIEKHAFNGVYLAAMPAEMVITVTDELASITIE